MIDRSNYEIWLTDWIDNRLTKEQAGELNNFLDANPDLKEEFEAISSFRIQPAKRKASEYPGKPGLKKNAADISRNQFELLCTAYIENDLDEFHLAEFREMLRNDPSRVKILETIKRLRLTPPKDRYPSKWKLKHYNAARITMFSALSGAAAALVFLLLTGILGRQDIQPQLSSDLIDTIYISRPTEYISGAPEFSDTVSKTSQIAPMASTAHVLEASIHSPRQPLIHEISGINAVSVDHLQFHSESPTLFNNIIPVTQEKDIIKHDHRSSFGRLIAMTFREKVLARDDYNDTPIKGYELAEAGISGLNKLLGWEMDLIAKNDENGQLRSLSFSSGVLKFNTPVRKNQIKE